MSIGTMGLYQDCQASALFGVTKTGYQIDIHLSQRNPHLLSQINVTTSVILVASLFCRNLQMILTEVLNNNRQPVLQDLGGHIPEE